MERLSTNSPVDKILDGGLEKGAVTNVFGPPGAGKTNIALSTTLNCENKVIYIDTEGSFSLERFRQMGGDEKKLKTVLLIEPESWQEQHKEIGRLERILTKERIDLIVVDSLVALYRLEMNNKNFKEVNRQLATQYSVLSRLARKYNIPVLVTNQIYSRGEEVELTSRMVARYWSKCLLELKRGDRANQRVAILRKHRSLPENKRVEFEITEKGLKEPRFSLF